ncbi:hypothetical protein D3C86_1548240 [compost metagenome]
MLEVGFSAMLVTICCPLLIPPRMPPAWLLWKPSLVISSRFWLPRSATTSKPSPISTPFTALMLIIAWAMSASRRSKTGSPRPGGTPSATTVTFAPMESPSFFRPRISSSRASILSASAQKNGFCSTRSQSLIASGMSPIWVRQPRITMPNFCARYFFAIAPAATRMAVSRAEERPPPR